MFREVDIDLLELAPERKRQGISYPSAEELQRLHAYGVTTPLTARPIAGSAPQRFTIISGETTWIGAQMMGIHRVPVYIREDLTEEDAARLSAGETPEGTADNVLRRARAMRSLLDAEPGLTRTELAHRLRMTLSSLSHHLRLLKLPAPVVALLEEGKLGYGHARPLLGLPRKEDQIELARLIVRRSLPVRTVERTVRALVRNRRPVAEALADAMKVEEGRAGREPPDSEGADSPAPKSPDLLRLERELSEALGSPVEIDQQPGGRGTLMIHFHTLEILDGIIERLGLGEIG